ncbi:hypothetical protein WMY93_000188 [Mugilogobius chulae]|uniref:Transducer of regulated CREB activity C-terminal domain-containing protein n=1 Tax=Mugilogobius chulae TaxID=88201 RepID=A0AAW0Q1R9_9GOBI
MAAVWMEKKKQQQQAERRSAQRPGRRQRSRGTPGMESRTSRIWSGTEACAEVERHSTGPGGSAVSAQTRCVSPRRGWIKRQTGLVQMSSLNSTTDNQSSPQSNMTIDMNVCQASSQYRTRMGSSANQSPTSPVSNQGFSPGGSPQHNSILGSVFADFYDQQLPSIQTSALSQQLEQFNMFETPVSSDSLAYNQNSTLNYSQALMMGLSGPHLQDPQGLGFGNHGNIPNIILTVSGESPPSLNKELGCLSADLDLDSQFPLDDLKIDPLTLDGLHMLNDPDMVLTDAATGGRVQAGPAVTAPAPAPVCNHTAARGLD